MAGAVRTRNAMHSYDISFSFQVTGMIHGFRFLNMASFRTKKKDVRLPEGIFAQISSYPWYLPHAKATQKCLHRAGLLSPLPSSACHFPQGRLTQLADWAANPTEPPTVTWLSGLFNPQSFLTAIMQVRDAPSA